MNRYIKCLSAFLTLGCVAPFAQADLTIAATAATTAPASAPAATISIAILDFDVATAAAPEFGKQIDDVLSSTLSDDPNLQLVDRSSMTKTLNEHALNQSGLVDPNQAVKIGKLIGARLLVVGRAFPMDKQMYLTAKVIGTETGLVDAVAVNGDRDGDVAPLVLQLSKKISQKVTQDSAKLLPSDDASLDPLPALQRRLAGRKLPRLAIAVSERHIAEQVPARIDPAVETELRKILLQCGFAVADGDETQWASQGVDIVVTGEAFSEFQTHIGSLVSCSARAEIKAADRKSGNLIFSDRVTTRAADLAENTAGKTALQNAGHQMAIALLQHFDQTLPPIIR